jgi:hypothetical protein
MSRRLLSIVGGIALTFATASAVLAQNTGTTTTTTTTQSTVVQNADGSWTVIEYPVGKEVVVNLTPTTTIPGATGTAKVMRSADGTMIHLNLSNITGDVKDLNLYAVDPLGKATLLGPVTVENGVATFNTTTTLDKFMLVLSPEANLAAVTPQTNIILRSAVPTGFAVVPLASSGERDGAAVGERVAATTTPNPTSAYNVPMLGIPGFRQGTDTHMRIKFSGDLQGVRANAFIKPRKDGATQITLRFHELKEAPPNTRLVLWAVGPDSKFVKLGQVINTSGRNEGKIATETALKDFGLFVTVEPTEDVISPSGTIVSDFAIEQPTK